MVTCVLIEAALHDAASTLTPCRLSPPPENPLRALRTQIFPAEPVSQRQLAAGRRSRRRRGQPSLGALPADQLAAGAAGGSHQGAEGVAARHRAPHLQLLPQTAQRRLRAAPELQGRKSTVSVSLA